jgi:TnpA family transposase
MICRKMLIHATDRCKFTGYCQQFGSPMCFIKCQSGLALSTISPCLDRSAAQRRTRISCQPHCRGYQSWADADGRHRRALLRMQTWHMREDTFRAALATLTNAIHAEPLAAWFGEGWRASADGQHFYLGGPGESGGTVNAHYGRDPIVKIYTTITDRYAPLHQTVIAGTAGEAIHALDGILGHESDVEVGALHVDGGGVSDIVFCTMSMLGFNFEPRIPRLSDRKLYAFEPRARYGKLAPLFGNRLDENLIRSHWDDIHQVIRQCGIGW